MFGAAPRANQFFDHPRHVEHQHGAAVAQVGGAGDAGHLLEAAAERLGDDVLLAEQERPPRAPPAAAPGPPAPRSGGRAAGRAGRTACASRTKGIVCPRRLNTSRRSTVRRSDSLTERISSTLLSGTAKVRPRHLHHQRAQMARVSGRVRVKVRAAPALAGRCRSSPTAARGWSSPRRGRPRAPTARSPPRAVEKPGRKMRLSSSRRSISSACVGGDQPALERHLADAVARRGRRRRRPPRRPRGCPAGWPAAAPRPRRGLPALGAPRAPRCRGRSRCA